MMMRGFILLLCLLFALCESNHCPLKAGAQGSLFLNEPAPRPLSSTSCLLFNSSCCSSAGFAAVAAHSDTLFVAAESKLNALASNQGCRDAIELLTCAVCSPDQDYIFTLQTFETDMLLCPAFADSVFAGSVLSFFFFFFFFF
jgi:hypothetical protein